MWEHLCSVSTNVLNAIVRKIAFPQDKSFHTLQCDHLVEESGWTLFAVYKITGSISHEKQDKHFFFSCHAQQKQLQCSNEIP